MNLSDFAGGYEEIEHTADWSLRVWGPTLADLFIQAACGMFDLMGVATNGEKVMQQIVVRGDDPESLLVAFLSELLYLLGEEKLVSLPQEVQVGEHQVVAAVSQEALTAQGKEIKAVTYYRLNIQQTPQGYETEVTFDV